MNQEIYLIYSSVAPLLSRPLLQRVDSLLLNNKVSGGGGEGSVRLLVVVVKNGKLSNGQNIKQYVLCCSGDCYLHRRRRRRRCCWSSFCAAQDGADHCQFVHRHHRSPYFKKEEKFNIALNGETVEMEEVEGVEEGCIVLVDYPLFRRALLYI